MSCRTKAGCGTLFGLVIRNKNEGENDELDRIVYRGCFRGGHDFLFREDQGGPGYGGLTLDRRVRPGDSVEYGFAGQSRADAPDRYRVRYLDRRGSSRYGVAGDFRLRRIGGFRPDFFYRYLVRFYRRTKIGFALNILNKDGRNIRDVDCGFSDF